MSSRTEQRKSSFKKVTDADEARRKRQEASLDIRKGKREESLSKKRREAIVEQQDPTNTITEDLSQYNHELGHLVNMVNCGDAIKQLEGVVGIRKKLSVEKNPPINEVIKTGIVPKLISLLTHNDQPKLQFEAAWSLTNIASGDSAQTRFVVDAGCIPYFVQLLSSPSEEVREQAIWAIGNIAGDGPHCRDALLTHRVIPALLNIIVPSAKITLIRNGTWTLSNLCRGKPAPKFDLVRPALPLVALLLTSSDEEVLTDACWASSYLSDGTNDKIQEVIDAGIPAFLVKYLAHSNVQVHTPALRAVGNIVTGDEAQTQAVLNFDPFPKILALLGSTRKGVRKEACWAISNITAGNKAQIQSVIDSNLVPTLINLLSTGDFDVKREACWAISNATTGGSVQQIAYFVKHGCIKPLCDVLVSSDSKIVSVALEAIENILKCGQELASKTTNEENKFADLVEEAEGIDKISELQTHKNADIYKKAVEILEVYFNAEEDENQNLVPNANANTFNFGVATSVPSMTTFSF